MNLKCLFKHTWVIAERKSKHGDFKVGWGSIYFYEKCVICGKNRDNSPFSEKLTEKVEALNDRAHRLKEFIQNRNRK